ncbi:MAG TPA: hypothetical protein VI636_17215 [Candidatus Angelobacter sp.]
MSDIPSVLQAEWFFSLQKEEPITAALCQLLALQVGALKDAFSGAPPVTQHHTDALGKVVKSIREIVSWLGPAPAQEHPKSATEREKEKSEWMKQCLDWGGSTLQAVQVGEAFDRSLKGRPGRHPAVSRRLAVQYIEQKLKTPALNLPTFTKQNCPCRKEKHDLPCEERIRQQIIALKRIFARHGLTWPLCEG